MATNNLTAQAVVLDLLQYIGVTGFTAVANQQALNQPGLDDVDTARALAAVNSGLQTIQKWGPHAYKRGERSVSYAVPSAHTLNIVAAAKTAVASVAPSATLKGCSIMIDGDADINRIVSISGTTITLLRGYQGATNTAATATVYSDCATVDVDVQAIVEPVSGRPNVRMYRASDIDDFERFRQRYWVMCYASGGYYGGTIESLARNPGVPVRWIEERQRDGTLLLRVTPMPAAVFTVTFQAKLRAERITATVLDLTGASDPGYYFNSVHDDDVESILLPIARWRFFAHPALKNAESAQRVKLEYDEAMLLLKHGQNLEPSVSDNHVTYI